MDWYEAGFRPPCFVPDCGVGFGFGERMKGALMLIVYTSGKNKSGMAGRRERSRRT